MTVRRALLALLAALVAACAAQSGGAKPGAPALVRPAHVSEPLLTCAEATRVAGEALTRMGYSIGRVEAAKPEAPGTVVATRDTGWSPSRPEAGTLHTVTVTIRCSDAGSELDAVTDEGMTTQLNFPTRFAAAVKQRTNVKPVRPRYLQEAEPQGLIVNVEPQRGSAAQHEFGLDLPAAGVTPVKVEVHNRTSRRYGFQRSAVELVTTQGSRAAPLSVAAAAERVRQLAGTSDVAARLEQRQIADTKIQPGASLSGYLYFKAAAYRRARVVLTDVESDEPEGFSVEF